MDAALLHDAGRRFTPQRFLILQILEQASHHLTMDEIIQRVQENNPHVNVGTVYRTLKLFREMGLLRENHFPGQDPSYELTTSSRHHHLVCRRCGKVEHLPDEIIGPLDAQLERGYAFHHLTLSLLAMGYCEQCWQQELPETP